MQDTYLLSMQRLNRHLKQQQSSIEAFLNTLQTKPTSDPQIIYDFQLLMNSLSTIQAEADRLTQSFDHG